MQFKSKFDIHYVHTMYNVQHSMDPGHWPPAMCKFQMVVDIFDVDDLFMGFNAVSGELPQRPTQILIYSTVRYIRHTMFRKIYVYGCQFIQHKTHHTSFYSSERMKKTRSAVCLIKSLANE